LRIINYKLQVFSKIESLTYRKDGGDYKNVQENWGRVNE